MSVKKLLTLANKHGCSDVHISPGLPPLVRLHGDLQPLPDPDWPQFELPADATRQLLYEILTDQQEERLEKDLAVDFSFQLADVARFRANVFSQDRGLAGVFRIIPADIMTLDDLNMPPVVRHLAEIKRGMVLVTGPTGSGKSTTLAAMVHHINKTKREHILTVEDPIEFVHKPIKSLISQREIGKHATSFASALRSALREDPDVILVGEMRDLETISLAIKAAETGHVVFGTLHTTSAAKTVDRVVNVFPTDEQEQIRVMLSEGLCGVISQVLCPLKEGGGRIAGLEIMIGSQGVRGLIREGKNFQIATAMQTGRRYGMQSLKNHLDQLVTEGKVAAEVAAKYTGNESPIPVGDALNAPIQQEPAAPPHDQRRSAPPGQRPPRRGSSGRQQRPPKGRYSSPYKSDNPPKRGDDGDSDQGGGRRRYRYK